MQLSYQKKGNYTYAKVPGESYRENGHVKSAMLFILAVLSTRKTMYSLTKNAAYLHMMPLQAPMVRQLPHFRAI